MAPPPSTQIRFRTPVHPQPPPSTVDPSTGPGLRSLLPRKSLETHQVKPKRPPVSPSISRVLLPLSLSRTQTSPNLPSNVS